MEIQLSDNINENGPKLIMNESIHCARAVVSDVFLLSPAPAFCVVHHVMSRRNDTVTVTHTQRRNSGTLYAMLF